MSRTQRLLTVLALNLVLVAGLVTAGVTAHSLAVLAAGGDYLLDAAGVGVALYAIRLSAGRASQRAWLGRGRATQVAALVNGGWLLVLELLVVAAAADRLINRTPEVHGLPVLVASAVAALVMTAGALVLRGDADDSAQIGAELGEDREADEPGEGARERDLSVAAVLLDTVADAAAAAGVAVAGAIILVTHGWYWLDPAVALAIALVVAYHATVLILKVLGRLRRASAAGRPGEPPRPAG